MFKNGPLVSIVIVAYNSEKYIIDTLKSCSGQSYNNIEIIYKTQIKLGDKIVCLYTKEENKHIVTIKSEDEKTLHAIVELY